LIHIFESEKTIYAAWYSALLSDLSAHWWPSTYTTQEHLVSANTTKFQLLHIAKLRLQASAQGRSPLINLVRHVSGTIECAAQCRDRNAITMHWIVHAEANGWPGLFRRCQEASRHHRCNSVRSQTHITIFRRASFQIFVSTYRTSRQQQVRTSTPHLRRQQLLFARGRILIVAQSHPSAPRPSAFDVAILA
jgi:hypothetical protein